MSRIGFWPSAALVVCVSTLLPASVYPATAEPMAATADALYSGQSVADFFPSIKGDLTKVTWVHAVNSEALLQSALNGSAMMLEADVIMGTKQNSSTMIPVMGHPPATTSDLSLEDFLRHVITYNMNATKHRKGIKLDFKSTEAFEKSADPLKQTFSDAPDFPVWLNADILSGPVNSTTTPVDATVFLTKAVALFPKFTLSLGWATRWGTQLNGTKTTPEEGQYSEGQVKTMLDVLKSSKANQPVTYAIRAGIAAHSLDNLQHLLNNTTGNATLTVWSSNNDTVDVAALRKTILTIGKGRVYVDVPENILKELDLASSSTTSTASLGVVMLAALLGFGMYV